VSKPTRKQLKKRVAYLERVVCVLCDRLLEEGQETPAASAGIRPNDEPPAAETVEAPVPLPTDELAVQYGGAA
jgi:hypothetical protein